MGSANEVYESTLQQLIQLRLSLLRLHKTLLDLEREAYERTHGRRIGAL